MPTLRDMQNISRSRGLPQAVAAPLYGDFGSMLNTDLLDQWKMMSPEQQAKSWYKFTGNDPTSAEDTTSRWQFSYDPNKMPEQWRGLKPEYVQPDNGTRGWMRYDQAFLDSLPKTGFDKDGKPMTAGWDQSKTMYNTLASLGATPTSIYTGGEGHGALANPNLKYYDKNYGWITPQANTYNVDPHQPGAFKVLDKYAMPAAMAIASMFGGPPIALGLQAFNAGKGAIGGEPWQKIAMNALPGLIGAGVGGLGGLGEWGDFMKYAKLGLGGYNAFRKHDPVGGAMTLSRLSGLGG